MYGPRPPVWNWYLAYVALMALLYIGTGIAFLTFGMIVPPGELPPEDMIMFWIMPACTCPFGILYLAAFFLPKEPWAWVYHLVLICIGLTSACCMPVCIPLMIFWLKPETKAYFGRER